MFLFLFTFIACTEKIKQYLVINKTVLIKTMCLLNIKKKLFSDILTFGNILLWDMSGKLSSLTIKWYTRKSKCWSIRWWIGQPSFECIPNAWLSMISQFEILASIWHQRDIVKCWYIAKKRRNKHLNVIRMDVQCTETLDFFWFFINFFHN